MLIKHFEHLRHSQHELTSNDFVGDVIHNFGRILLEHSNHEEEIMKGCNVPDDIFSKHAAAHLAIINEWSNLQILIMTGPIPVAEILGMIENWTNPHLLEYDLEIKQYIS